MNDADVIATAAAATEDLRATAARIERLRSELADEGLDREELETVADAYRSVEAVLDRWEERATDWDDFEGYVKFRNDLAETLESIPDDVPERDAFVDADDCVKTGGVSKSLRSGDFDAAREALAPARRYAGLRADLESASEKHRAAKRRAGEQRRALRERIRTLERLAELGEADLGAPIDRLHGPIEAYNARVAEAFETFRREATAETFLEFVDGAAHTPFVDYEAPPAELLEYVRSRDAGEYPIEKFLEYATYSPSKLTHYVDDADLLKRRVATNRTYLERLSAEPLNVEWPPETAERLRFRIDELVGIVGRLGDETAVATLREIRSLTRDDEYERIRRAARAAEELTEKQQERLERGEVEEALGTAREALETLESSLDEHTD
ncbi:MAG: DUF7118 family protein [Halobacteriota archaeon]|uniref:DUF7118 family protein n=1 Tax=Natronomonas sp. TaxID=2184060 RepID=UPI00397527A4